MLLCQVSGEPGPAGSRLLLVSGKTGNSFACQKSDAAAIPVEAKSPGVTVLGKDLSPRQ